jgi:ubiquitin C-terminal hydrolase
MDDKVKCPRCERREEVLVKMIQLDVLPDALVRYLKPFVLHNTT